MMEQRIDYLTFLSLLLFLYLCEGRRSKIVEEQLDSYYTDSSSQPFSPSGYNLSPSSSPLDFPPLCFLPPPYPLTPPNPPFILPGPPEYIPSPPEYNPSPSEFIPSPPEYNLSPPEFIPSPPEYNPSPPENFPGTPNFEPGPPIVIPSPPGLGPLVPSPPEFAPGPPIFLPPVIYPPPNVPPPPHAMTTAGLWCVAKPTVPDPIIQEAMNYACGSGADCDSIQPNGSCYQPDTLIAHASFAFNSYFQRTKVAGGTCDFGGTAMLITRDPSYDGCLFLIS